ncbi:UPF0687 protein C20orf27 homolog [Lingula anatina]|uniref:Adipose-secreted signaling protein n=1 Tax=Lingula anatina TaxID=7574 RepID=A0A1S3KDD3_LINAN|nr:UPF0687 protein C20orf27 homolog [Lingula anatina]|eukprot:XP_013420507.1 UPF0687 protein C20orf27 homolog [Lingula anatina]
MEFKHHHGGFPSHQPGGHVHFPQEQVVQHDSEIVICPEGDRTLGVHLGFLQHRHHYEVAFTIQDDLGEDVDIEPSLHARILEVMPSETEYPGHTVAVDLAAHKEKLMQEKITLRSRNDKNKAITLVLHARVLGRGKGTPALRNGIKCTGIDADEESEASDWMGFD